MRINKTKGPEQQEGDRLMHEMAYVRNVVDIVTDYAKSVEATRVYGVYLSIGVGRDIVDEYFQGLFQYLARNTVAAEAEITIRHVPFTVCCNHCETVFPINVHDDKTWVCPACKTARDYRLNTGMEFTVDQIEYTKNPREALKENERPKGSAGPKAESNGPERADGQATDIAENIMGSGLER